VRCSGEDIAVDVDATVLRSLGGFPVSDGLPPAVVDAVDAVVVDVRARTPSLFASSPSPPLWAAVLLLIVVVVSLLVVRLTTTDDGFFGSNVRAGLVSDRFRFVLDRQKGEKAYS
jgi:hypothetical protein